MKLDNSRLIRLFQKSVNCIKLKFNRRFIRFPFNFYISNFYFRIEYESKPSFFPPSPLWKEINLRFELTGSKNNKSKFDYRIRNTRSSIRFDYQANHKSISIRAAICRSRYREMLDVSVSVRFHEYRKCRKKINRYWQISSDERINSSVSISHFSIRGFKVYRA